MMRLQKLPSQRLFLQPGEVMPVVCRCGCIYVPSPGAQSSACPLCRRDWSHLEIEFEVFPRLRSAPFGSGV
jgi:hypothetical protein